VLPLQYKGVLLSKGYTLDFLIEEAVVVEIKSVDKLLPIHSAQLLTYMRLLGYPAACSSISTFTFYPLVSKEYCSKSHAGCVLCLPWFAVAVGSQLSWVAVTLAPSGYSP
jgi:PD-(D/E)XK nuclease superfamily